MIAKLKKRKKQLMIAAIELVLLFTIVVFVTKGHDGSAGSLGAYFAASHSSVKNASRSDYISQLLSAMNGETSMFDSLDQDTAHVRALNWLRMDFIAQAFASNGDLDLLLEHYVLTLTAFVSSGHKWIDFVIPKHDSWCGNLGISCNEDGRVTGLEIDSLGKQSVPSSMQAKSSSLLIISPIKQMIWKYK